MLDPVAAALRISWMSILWSAVAGVASVVLGLGAASVALAGSGATVFIDLTSSAVLVWRFRHPHGHLAAERIANFVAAAALSTLCVVLAWLSVSRLASSGSAHPNLASIGIAAASLAVLPLLALVKYRAARRVPSQALTADAHITVIGASTATLTLSGLALTHLGVDVADPLAGLVIAMTAGVMGIREFAMLRKRT